ncbi:MAG: hypothetical protein CMA12_03710, partial [Euryarchaeota archaeon]
MVSIHCFGAGLVGSYVIKKLNSSGFNVHAYDPEPERISNIEGIEIHSISSNDDPVEILTYIIGQKDGIEFNPEEDIVVNMLPGSIGHISTSKLAEKPWRTIDLSFSEYTPDRVHEKSKLNGASILWDTGIAPGLSNMLLSESYKKLGPLKNGIIRVGGNPTEQNSGWSYMAPFSPIDVIAEYTRPARIIRDSEVISLPALSERHMITVDGKGEMEAFLTDGLRSVLYSIPSEELSEYTVRWPGHIQKYIDQRNDDSLDINSLMDQWKYDPKIPEFTWMEIMAVGKHGTTIKWTVEDHGAEDGHSMARSTGLVTICCIEEWVKNPNMI